MAKEKLVALAVCVLAVAAAFEFSSFMFWFVGIATGAVYLFVGGLLEGATHMEVTNLWIYPIKGCAGIEVSEAKVDYVGFVNDRRWVVSDENGNFVTQREKPRMVLIQPRLVPTDQGRDQLELTAPGMTPLLVPLVQIESQEASVQVWDDNVKALDTGVETSAWLTKFLGAPVRLLESRPNNQHSRPIRHKAGKLADLNGDETDKIQVSFADAFPFLLTTTKSLQDLNNRIAAASEDPTNANQVTMLQFRPNIVVNNSRPFEEDSWFSIVIGAAGTFKAVKPCTRCVVPCVDPATGIVHQRFEPRRTLQTYRKIEDKIFFGQNLVHSSIGDFVRVGDRVTVMSTKAPNPPLTHQ
eukprot:c983_g1_i1.p1 GENE.c983_g1_i1~~c983_g1_i1.p1  ORF type:complete len:364 (+),score=86.44 c983_g1_i1:33-1094(+)